MMLSLLERHREQFALWSSGNGHVFNARELVSSAVGANTRGPPEAVPPEARQWGCQGR